MSGVSDRSRSELVAEAAATAEEAARKSGVVVRELTNVDEHHLAAALFEEVWQTAGGQAPLNPSLIRAAVHIGNYMVGAYADDTLVGATFGLFAADGHLHSQIAGVLASHQGRGVGLALKLHQRMWALEGGIDLISWTFDPLVRRNAYFNIHRLGVEPVSYLPQFYGEMRDGVNAGDDTDRLFVHWHLATPGVDLAIARQRPEVDTDAIRERSAVSVDVVGGQPVVADIPADARTVLVAVPEDIEAIRSENPELARLWRRAVRVGLGTVLDRGYRITAMTRDGWFVLEER